MAADRAHVAKAAEAILALRERHDEVDVDSHSFDLAQAAVDAVAEDIAAQAKAEALRDMRRLAARCYPPGLVSTATVIADLNERLERLA